MKPQNWEEAFDQLADENNTLWNALNQLVSLWDMEASLSELENSNRPFRASLHDVSVDFFSLPESVRTAQGLIKVLERVG